MGDHDNATNQWMRKDLAKLDTKYRHLLSVIQNEIELNMITDLKELTAEASSFHQTFALTSRKCHFQDKLQTKTHTQPFSPCEGWGFVEPRMDLSPTGWLRQIPLAPFRLISWGAC